MEINLNIQKRHLVIFFIGLFIAMSVLIYAQGIQVDKSLPYHPLTQVSKSLTDDTSVDANQNGVIDVAEVALNGGNGTGGGSTGGSFSMNYQIIDSGWSGTPPDITANCPSDYTLTGGSCSWQDTDGKWGDAQGEPNGNGWRCTSWDASRKARSWAYCAQTVVSGGGSSSNMKFFSGVEQIPKGDGKITINLNDSVVFAYAASGRDSFTEGFYCNLIVSVSNWHGNSFDIDYNRIGSGGCNTAAFTANWFAVVAGGPDNDGDGYSAPYDCDDNDPDTYPGAPELDDGKDNDCDDNV